MQLMREARHQWRGRRHFGFLALMFLGSGCSIDPSAENATPAPSAAEKQELPDTVPALLTLSGMVVDEFYRPAKGAPLFIDIPWSRPFRAFHESDEHGHFEWKLDSQSDPLLDALCIHAVSDGLASNRVRARSGATDLVLRLQPTGSLSIEVLLDGEVKNADQSQLFSLIVAKLDSPQRPAMPADEIWIREGRDTIRGLLPGTYALTVEPNGGLCPPWHIKGIEIRAGTTTRDPRLEPLDLRGMFSVFCFTAEQSGGDAPWLSLRTRRVDGPREEWDVKSWSGSSADAIRPRGVYEIVVSPSGYRDARFVGESFSEKLALRPGLPVDLKVSADAASAEHEPQLVPEECVSAADWRIVSSFGERTAGGWRFVLGDPGRWRVVWSPRDVGEPCVLGTDPAWIEVLDQQEPQRFVVKPPPPSDPKD